MNQLEGKNFSEIINYIIDNFHNKHRQDFRDLIPLAKKVETVHADKIESPQGLSDFLGKMFFELESHMQKEEQVLFPMIKSEQYQMAQMPIQMMMQEHIDHTENLKTLKKLAKNYILPENACGSWRRLYAGVEALENDLRNHIDLEDNFFFPKILNKNSEDTPSGCCGSCS